MPHKPNKSWSVPELKKYIRDNKLADKDIRLGMKKAEMVVALKKKGHWDESHVSTKEFKDARKGLIKIMAREPGKKRKTPKKVPMGKLKKTYLPSETATAIMHQVLDDQINQTGNQPRITADQLELQRMLGDSYTIDDEIAQLHSLVPS
tara:strand:- start:732 stop:1178 length:447 start_codon:yes stop_codon:yes gene_type:complete